MARSVRVGDFQAMQRNRQPAATETSFEPLDGEGIDVATALTVPEQLAELELHVSDTPPYDEVVKRLTVRAGLFGIPALDEEIAAEARRRCKMLPEITAGSATTNEVENGEVQVARILAEKHARGLHTVFVVGGCPSCEGDEAEPTVEDAIAAAEGLPLYADAPDEVIMSLGQDDPAGDGPLEPRAEDRLDDKLDAVARSMAHAVASGTVAAISVTPADGINEPQPDAMTRPVAREMLLLDIGARCTAEMSLHMITERVRDAVLETDWGKLATDAEIVAEAERIWVSLDRKRSHTYSVESDGSVRDWRRPDTTPDRGDVTTVHTITDDEPRFSGAGAADVQQQGLFLVPEDRQFNGKLYRDAPELANIAEKLIGEHGFLEGLVNCEIRYYWRRKTGVSKGRVKIGYCKRASDLLGHFSGADFIIWLSATTARDGKFTDRQVEAAIFHQLCHIETDDEGNFISARHDFEGFAQEIRHYGVWTQDLKTLVTAVTAAQQMGLFDVDDEGIDDEDDDAEDEREEAARVGYVETADGAGVLIHDDGTPMTADEIAQMEAAEESGEEEDDDDELDAAEQADCDEFDADRPADPDGPAPDELDDDL